MRPRAQGERATPEAGSDPQLTAAAGKQGPRSQGHPDLNSAHEGAWKQVSSELPAEPCTPRLDFGLGRPGAENQAGPPDFPPEKRR